MFLFRKPHLDSELGQFEYAAGHWSQERKLNELKYWIFVPGSKRRPDELAMTAARSLVADLGDFVETGWKFIESLDATDIEADIGDLQFESVYLGESAGSFDIGFGEQAGDWEIVIHFKDSSPYDFSCNH